MGKMSNLDKLFLFPGLTEDACQGFWPTATFQNTRRIALTSARSITKTEQLR